MGGLTKSEAEAITALEKRKGMKSNADQAATPSAEVIEIAGAFKTSMRYRFNPDGKCMVDENA